MAALKHGKVIRPEFHFNGLQLFRSDSLLLHLVENLVMAREHVPAIVNWKREIKALGDFMDKMPFRVDPTAYITAGEYARQARKVLEEIKMRGRVPIVVGGTGLYLQALLEGLFPGPDRSEELRDRLRQRAKKKAYLHRLLDRFDPAAAAKIHANDTPKLIRAIEVCLASRKEMSEMWKEGHDPLKGFRVLRLGLNPDRAALYQRINQRAQQMFDSGLVEETRSMLEKYGNSASPLSSLGYKQAMQLLRGEIDRDAAIQAAQQAHRGIGMHRIGEQLLPRRRIT